MASFQKLVFFSAVFSLTIILGAAAPLRVLRPRQSTPDSDPSSVPLTLPPQQSNFTFDLASALPAASSTLTSLATVPAACALYNTAAAITPPAECPTFFAAASVTYGDCGAAWTVCRCSTAEMDMAAVVERLGRVPVGLRRYVGTVVVGPARADMLGQASAYTLTNGDVHVFGDAGVDTWVHEVGDWFGCMYYILY